LFIFGMKRYGRAPPFLRATGREQARSVLAALAGDMEAASRAEPQLPETGICSTGPIRIKSTIAVVAASCCGGLVPAETEACCADDVVAKAGGEAGCGCPSTPILEPVAAGCCTGS